MICSKREINFPDFVLSNSSRSTQVCLYILGAKPSIITINFSDVLRDISIVFVVSATLSVCFCFALFLFVAPIFSALVKI